MPSLPRTVNNQQLTGNLSKKRQLSDVSCRLFKMGFTLVELLIVIAILAILAAGVMVAINPGKRTAQARDAIRKSDVNAIANALVAYYTIKENYPTEKMCDTSRGSTGTWDEGDGISGPLCPDQVSQSDWQDYSQSIFRQLRDEGHLKRLPKDPKNNDVFYYKYEPSDDTSHGCTFNPCTRYWIGVRLESVDNPAEIGRRVFRCSDDTSLSDKAGCKEVLFQDATDILSFDFSFATK